VTQAFYKALLFAAAANVFLLGVCLAEEVKQTMTQAFECAKIDKPYVHLPMKDDAPEVRLLVNIDGELQHSIDVKLAQDKPDWNGTFSVQKWMGKKLTIVPEKPLAESGWIRNVKMSDQLSDEESVYKEKYRPQFHFSARRGCITDLDGPIYFNGEYHIFPGHRAWQLNGNAGSNPLWGHAVSKDLIHWEELGTAVSANKLGSPWSGSTAIDWYNTAGFVKNPIKDKDGRLKNPALVAIYTNGHGGRSVPEPTQSLNYSLDSGRTWIEYPGNPVMPFVAVYNRDPKIVWYEDKANPDNSHWVVVLLLDGPNSSIWTSKDMIHWERSQTLDNIDVCPDCADFYEIALDGDPNNKKWILWFGDGNYNVGTFDGKTFRKEIGPIKSKTERTPGDRDRNIHIAQTFTGIPAEDGRRIQMGWILGDAKKGPQFPFPGMPFAGQYTLPHVLTLRTTPDGPRLFFEPAKETEKLRTGVSAQMPKTTLDGTAMLLKEDKPIGELVEVNAVFTVNKDVMAEPGENIVGLDINGQMVTCNLDNEQMIGNDGYQPLKVVDGLLKLRVFVDRTVVDSFAAGVPWAPLAYPFMPADNPTYAIKVFGKKGLADVEVEAYQLKSIWQGNRL
jgi:fructan beta-fructosidase